MAGLETVQAISSILGGLGGIFGGKKKSKNQNLQEALSNMQLEGQQKLLPEQINALMSQLGLQNSQAMSERRLLPGQTALSQAQTAAQSRLLPQQLALSQSQLGSIQSLLPGQTALQQQMLNNAAKYNPDAANADLIRRIEESGQRNADLGQREVMAAARRNGASPGDTGTVALRQRSLDNAWNPVGMNLAQIHSEAPFKQAQLQSQALNSSRGGSVMGIQTTMRPNRDIVQGINQMGYQQEPQQDNSSSWMALGNGIQGLLPKKKQPPIPYR